MRSRVCSLTLVAALSAFALSACASHAPVSITTPQGKAAFAGNEVLKRVQEVENAVIRAATPDAAGHVAVKKPVADILVSFCKDAALSIDQMPNGWLAVVSTAWTRAELRIPPAELASVQGYVLAIDTLLAGAGGSNGPEASGSPRDANRIARNSELRPLASRRDGRTPERRTDHRGDARTCGEYQREG